jgi:hypothetical protein
MSDGAHEILIGAVIATRAARFARVVQRLFTPDETREPESIAVGHIDFESGYLDITVPLPASAPQVSGRRESVTIVLRPPRLFMQVAGAWSELPSGEETESVLRPDALFDLLAGLGAANVPDTREETGGVEVLEFELLIADLPPDLAALALRVWDLEAESDPRPGRIAIRDGVIQRIAVLDAARNVTCSVEVTDVGVPFEFLSPRMGES